MSLANFFVFMHESSYQKGSVVCWSWSLDWEMEPRQRSGFSLSGDQARTDSLHCPPMIHTFFFSRIRAGPCGCTTWTQTHLSKLYGRHHLVLVVSLSPACLCSPHIFISPPPSPTSFLSISLFLSLFPFSVMLAPHGGI